MAIDKAVIGLLSAARRVFNCKGQAVLIAGGERFRVKSAELDEEYELIHCEGPDDDAEITIRASSLVAVEEIVDSYP